MFIFDKIVFYCPYFPIPLLHLGLSKFLSPIFQIRRDIRCGFSHQTIPGSLVVQLLSYFDSFSTPWTPLESMDFDPPDSSVHGISQTQILKWVAISFSRGSSPPRDQARGPAWQEDSLLLSHLGSPLSQDGSCKIYLRGLCEK